MDVSTWFAGFHVIQLALTGLVALSVVLLADDFGRANAWLTRLGVGVFLVFFSAYEAVAGIATGLAMRSARDLSPVQQTVYSTSSRTGRLWGRRSPSASWGHSVGWLRSVLSLSRPVAKAYRVPSGSSSRWRQCS